MAAPSFPAFVPAAAHCAHYVGCAPLSPHIGVFWRSGLCLRLGTSLGRMGAWHSVRYDPVPLRLGAGGGYVHRRSVRARCGESIWGWGVTRGGRSPGTGILMGRRWIQCVKAVHCKGGRARRGAARNSTHSAGPHTAPPPQRGPAPPPAVSTPPSPTAGRERRSPQAARRALPSPCDPLAATAFCYRRLPSAIGENRRPSALWHRLLPAGSGGGNFGGSAASAPLRSSPLRSAPLRAAPPARSPAPRRSAPRVR